MSRRLLTHYLLLFAVVFHTVVGVPLPFISYGGTALVTLCLGVGMLMSIQRSRLRARSS